ncbi:hypothetical protein Desti_4095 [Desulfomonile tiedjei DSM 6799]|uniref:Uncharacterized protein n=1 Tax=Desulfomonile tiedjei (strain ATCC 49306 / DSM 6799 / DCB-1) TaxID=706587 RepID=I4CAZ2_DESTA|nr:hypothetical protein Desti_4095 [Desulfomonile tiedjei DSM 6799]
MRFLIIGILLIAFSNFYRSAPSRCCRIVDSKNSFAHRVEASQTASTKK